MRVARADDWEAMLRDAVTRRERDGVHVSDTYCTLRGWVRRRYGSAPPTDEQAASWAMGLGWEDWLGRVMPGRLLVISRGRTYEHGGVQFSPDALVWEGGRGVSVVEIKAMRLPADTPLSEMPLVLYQAGAYVALVEEALGLPVAGAYIVRLHVAGYGGGRPTWRVDWCEWDEYERETLLSEVLERAAAIAGERQPAPAPKASWLCRGCVEGALVGCPLYRSNSTTGGGGRHVANHRG